jgi:hypothetical protein
LNAVLGLRYCRFIAAVRVVSTGGKRFLRTEICDYANLPVGFAGWGGHLMDL